MKMLALAVWRTIVISRPLLWPSSFLIFLLGVVFSESSITAGVFLVAGLWTFPYLLWVSAVNDLADVRADASNPFKSGLSGLKAKDSDRELLINLSFIGLVIVALASVIFVPRPGYLLFAAVALTVPYLYSARPVRLKERPPLDSLSIGLSAAAIFLAGFYVSGDSLPSMVVLQVAVGIFLVVSGIHVIAALRDYAADRQARVMTIAVAWGRQGSALFAALLFLLPLYMMNTLPLEIRLASIFAILSAAFLVLRPGEKRSLRLGLCLVVAFCAAAAYSIANESWEMLLTT